MKVNSNNYTQLLKEIDISGKVHLYIPFFNAVLETRPKHCQRADLYTCKRKHCDESPMLFIGINSIIWPVYIIIIGMFL